MPALKHALVLALACQAASAAAQSVSEGSCGIGNMMVAAPSASDLSDACVAVHAALPVLTSLGLELRQPVRIEVTQTLDLAPGICVAFYSSSERKVQLLPTDCLAEQPGRAKAFPEMTADLLFQSLIVHELTHALVEQGLAGRFLPRVAHEYLAYAIQLLALPETERSRILAKADISGPIDLAEVSEAILGLSPLRFAALSWLHFADNGGDAALVRRIVEGEVHFQSLRE
ncbi:DUF6639 family protein [Thetidibacter halocola]|uniref:Uncharacterized protein n=1 Tax=Thetidibacter halocola TaxID=2827239 RepID=A0A8J7WAC3_9RHOB|nr:DUF6639 family protein [Thetidibacter halocola]MBS0123860.1 hypothetical protein [Thetidibacter halocola]